MFNEFHLEGRVAIARSAYPAEVARSHFDRLSAETRWLRPGYANPTGHTLLPRLTANYGERSYDYSGLVFEPQSWTPHLRQLKNDAEIAAGSVFNALVLQLYRDGRDRVNWHSDDSPLVGINPIIVSILFGATRSFCFRNKREPDEKLKLSLHDGDLILMHGNLQHEYVHQVPREPATGPRLNLTFRWVTG